ncbi:hypothetical protein CHARACLAT_031167, partial [Characodon lateralis]|nr:hypothetical protein [Characodon lateralis]
GPQTPNLSFPPGGSVISFNKLHILLSTIFTASLWTYLFSPLLCTAGDLRPWCSRHYFPCENKPFKFCKVLLSVLCMWVRSVHTCTSLPERFALAVQLLASPEIYSRSLKVISEIFCKLALILPVLTLPGALPLDLTELTRDLKNRSEPSLKLNLQADSSASHQ